MSKTAKIRTVAVVDDPEVEFTYDENDRAFISMGKKGKARVAKKSKVMTFSKTAKSIPIPLNESGLEPTDYNCVVRLDKITDDAGEQVTSGGIIITKEKSERDQMAETFATLLAAGGNAFGDFKGRIPQVGDRVMISKYSGITREANPLDLIRVCKDKEILAVLV